LGRNYLETDRLTLNSCLPEKLELQAENYLFGRMERLDRNVSFGNDPAQEAIFAAQGIDSFTVNAFTLGYHGISLQERMAPGAGADAICTPSPDLDRSVA
jgi:hypothetical protein